MYIYGKNPIKDLFDKDHKLIKKVFIDKKRHQSFYNELENKKIPLDTFTNFNYKKFFKGHENFQGIVALIEEPKLFTLKDLIEKYKTKDNARFVILDQVHDPQNFGAIIRNSVAFGVDGIIFPARQSSPLSSIVMKSSAGTWINIDLCEVNSLNQTITELKKGGHWIVATSLQANSEMSVLKDFNQPLSIIFGNEGKGVRKSLLDKSDYKIKINISDKVDSLNVASTSAILLHYIQNK